MNPVVGRLVEGRLARLCADGCSDGWSGGVCVRVCESVHARDVDGVPPSPASATGELWVACHAKGAVILGVGQAVARTTARLAADWRSRDAAAYARSGWRTRQTHGTEGGVHVSLCGECGECVSHSSDSRVCRVGLCWVWYSLCECRCREREMYAPTRARASGTQLCNKKLGLLRNRATHPLCCGVGVGCCGGLVLLLGRGCVVRLCGVGVVSWGHVVWRSRPEFYGALLASMARISGGEGTSVERPEKYM